jgi:phage minor structural protein
MPLTIPQYITIKTAAGAMAAYLSPESDGLKDCFVNNELNGRCTLSFSLPTSSAKWLYLSNAYRIYAPDITGQMREFTIQNPDAVEKKRDGGKLWGQVTAHESWVLLGKKYTTVSNDPQTPSPPALAVIILSGGSNLSDYVYEVGTAAHALYALLQGTGWTVGTVDVTGINDLETEKETVLANVQKVQEIWGGYLVWDSINKTVSLRDETLWAPYTGYQIRYAKNEKSITRTDDYDIITKLYPFGENDLNIGSVNGGVIYLTNNSYTAEVLEGIWPNQDITDPQKLMDEGTKYLATVCRPRHNYRVKHVDLRLKSGYQHEDYDLGHLVDLIDEELGVDDRARIISYKFNVFQPWNPDLEVGDPIEKIESTLLESMQAAKFLNSIKNSKGELFTNIYLVDESIIRQKLANAAVDATKLDTKTVILLGDTWTDNSPTAGSVAWNQHKLYYAGFENVITAGNTALKYIYWDGAANAYSASATEPELAEGQFIIAVNNGGLHDIVWNKGYGRKFIGSAFIGDAAIKSAHIEELAVLSAHIASLDANKINVTDLTALSSEDSYTQMKGDGVRVYDSAGNLVGHLGYYETLSDQIATFGRPSPAYKSDGSQVASGVPRYEAGLFGQGIMVEEATTNILTANQSSVETDITGFTSGYNTNPGATITRTTSEHYSGSASLKIDCTAFGHGFDIIPVAATPGNSYTTKVRVKAPIGQPMRLRLVFFDNPITAEKGAIYTDFTGTGQWQEVKITMIAPALSGFACFGVSTRNNATFSFYGDCMQIAIKDTSWQIGGTARAAEILTIPAPGIFNSQEGTVEIWRSMDIPGSIAPSGVHRNILSLNAGVWGIYQPNGATNRIAFVVGDTWGAAKTAVANISWDAGDILFIVAKWDLPNISLIVYNLTKGTSITATATDASYTASPALTYVGCADGGQFTAHQNGLIDDLRISNIARTAEEISAAYASGLPLPVDANTNLKMSFDGHLRPTIRDYGLWTKNGRIILQDPQSGQGLEVWDGTTRKVLIGRLDDETIGQEIVGGALYSSLFRTGAKTDTAYIELVPPNMLRVIYNNKTAIEIVSGGLNGNIAVFDDDVEYVRLTGHYSLNSVGHTGLYSLNSRPLMLKGPASNITLDADGQITANPATGDYFLVQGNLGCTGSKPAIQQTLNYGQRALYARESPDVRFIDENVAQLIDGECKVDIDPIFLECIEANAATVPWLIHLTPYADTDVFVAEIGLTYFIVKERNGGISSGQFAWSLSAVRKGFANTRMDEFNPEGDILTSNWEDEFLCE